MGVMIVGASLAVALASCALSSLLFASDRNVIIGVIVAPGAVGLAVVGGF